MSVKLLMGSNRVYTPHDRMSNKTSLPDCWKTNFTHSIMGMVDISESIHKLTWCLLTQSGNCYANIVHNLEMFDCEPSSLLIVQAILSGPHAAEIPLFLTL